MPHTKKILTGGVSSKLMHFFPIFFLVTSVPAAQKHTFLQVRSGCELGVDWREGLACFLGTEHGRLPGGETGVWNGIPGQDEGWVLGEIGCTCW